MPLKPRRPIVAKPLNSPALLAWFAAFVAAVSTMLLLLGLGVAFAAEEAFGIPHALLFQSPQELLSVSTYALAMWLSAPFEMISSWGAFKRAAVNLDTFVMVFVLCGIALFFWFLARGQVRDWLRWAMEKIAPAWGRGWRLVLVSLCAVMLMPMLVTVVLSLIGAALGTVPMLGMIAAKHHINQWVIEPDECQQLSDRDTRLLRIEKGMKAENKKTGGTRRVALCVKVSRDKDVVQGRVAFSTGSTVILFCSTTGRVIRIPTEGALVEAIAAE